MRSGEPLRVRWRRSNLRMTRCQPRPAARMNALHVPCCGHLPSLRRSRVLEPRSLILRGTWNVPALQRSLPYVRTILFCPDCSALHQHSVSSWIPVTREPTSLPSSHRAYPSCRSSGLPLRVLLRSRWRLLSFSDRRCTRIHRSSSACFRSSFPCGSPDFPSLRLCFRSAAVRSPFEPGNPRLLKVHFPGKRRSARWEVGLTADCPSDPACPRFRGPGAATPCACY